MNKTIYNAKTGQSELVEMTPEEESVFEAQRQRQSILYDGAEFLARLTDGEYQAVIGLAQSNVQVARWLDTFRLRGEIDVLGATAQAAKTGLVALGAFSQARADELFS